MDPIIYFLGFDIVLEYDKKLLVNSRYSFLKNNWCISVWEMAHKSASFVMSHGCAHIRLEHFL